nr:hypothetical protein [bacterium]
MYMDGWLLSAALILVLFGCLDGVLRYLSIRKGAAIVGLAVLVLVHLFAGDFAFGQPVMLALVGACIIWLGYVGSSKKRLGFVAAFGLSTAAVVLLRVVIPLESGQLPFADSWLWAWPAAACAMVATLQPDAALFGGLSAMAAQSLVYSLVSGWLGRFEPVYITGAIPFLAAMAVLQILVQGMMAVIRLPLAPGNMDQ